MTLDFSFHESELYYLEGVSTPSLQDRILMREYDTKGFEGDEFLELEEVNERLGRSGR